MLNNFNFDKDEDNINKFKNKYSDLFLMNNFKKGKEDHSGSNFSLMNPSVGVKIRERNKTSKNYRYNKKRKNKNGK